MARRHQVVVYTVHPYSNVFNKNDLHFELLAEMPFKSSRYANPAIIGRLRRLMKEKQCDLIFFDQPWFGWVMMFMRLFTGKKIFLRSNNIEYLRFKSMGKWFWQILYIYEKWSYRAAHLVIFVSEADRQKAIYEFDLKAENTLLTPYGVEVTSVPPPKANARKMLQELYRIESNELILLFFATMSYGPNYEAVGFIADEIYPLLKTTPGKKFRILICGKGLPELVRKKLEGKAELIYCGFVEDIESYIDGCDLMINPILSGGGVKTKVVDTLARSKAVVSTRTGAEGIDLLVCGSKLTVVADNDWKAFVEQIRKHPAGQTAIPDEFYKTYAWVNIIENLTTRLGQLPV